jgi:DNA invertase Pin-like site-specific DNA recombinase
MAALLAVFAEFEREILWERVRAGLAHARQNRKKLGRPVTAGLHGAKIRKLHRAGVAKAEIARRLQIGRTSVRRIWAALFRNNRLHRPMHDNGYECRCSDLFLGSGRRSNRCTCLG